MFGMAIHGGAGTLPRAEMTDEAERRYRAGLQEAIDAGYAVLHSGGTSLDAVTRAVVSLEDNPLFNAGRGAVFTLDGRNELDASIMDGSTLQAGAVCGVRPWPMNTTFCSRPASSKARATPSDAPPML
jgi:L-asparaginase / beta-aspartyl-peptidase